MDRELIYTNSQSLRGRQLYTVDRVACIQHACTEQAFILASNFIMRALKQACTKA